MENQNLEDLREKWEKGYEFLYLLNFPSCKLSILSSGDTYNKTYTVHRYFTIGGQWEISVDLSQTDELQEVFKLIDEVAQKG